MFALGQILMVTEDGRHVRAVNADGTPAWWLARTGTNPAPSDPWAGVCYPRLPASRIVLAVAVSGRRARLLALTEDAVVVFDRTMTSKGVVNLKPHWPGTTWRGARGIRILAGGNVGILVAAQVSGVLQQSLLIFSPDLAVLERRVLLPGRPLPQNAPLVPFAVAGERIVYVGQEQQGQPLLYSVPLHPRAGTDVRIAPVPDSVRAIVTGPRGRVLTREDRKTRKKPKATPPHPEDEPEPTPPPQDASAILERDAHGKPTGRVFPTHSPNESRLAPSLNGFWVATSTPASPPTPAQLAFTKYDWEGAVRLKVAIPDFT